MAQRAESPADVTRRAVLFARVMTVGRGSRECYGPAHPAVDSSDLSGVECAELPHYSCEHDLKQDLSGCSEKIGTAPNRIRRIMGQRDRGCGSGRWPGSGHRTVDLLIMAC